MMTNKNKTELPPETIALLAEKGMRAARLSKKQKQTFLQTGFSEFYAVQKAHKTAEPPLSEPEVDRLMDRFFKPASGRAPTALSLVWIKMLDKAVKIIECDGCWTPGSPVFAVRGEVAQPAVAMHKEIGRLTLHLELISRANRLADIKLCLSDSASRDKTSFEAQLLKNGRCVESLSARTGECFVLSRIESGEYQLRVNDNHGEVASFLIRMD